MLTRYKIYKLCIAWTWKHKLSWTHFVWGTPMSPIYNLGRFAYFRWQGEGGKAPMASLFRKFTLIAFIIRFSF